MPDPDSSTFIYWIVLIVLVALGAFFTASETAIVMLSDGKVKRMAEEGDKRAKMILALTAQPTKFLSTIQVGITLSGLFPPPSAPIS
jgi:putative hemolysin